MFIYLLLKSKSVWNYQKVDKDKTYISKEGHILGHKRRNSSHTKRKEIVRGNQGKLNKAMGRIEQIKTLIN